jgi:hypothetical protein
MALSVGGCTITTGGPPPRRSSGYNSPPPPPRRASGHQGGGGTSTPAKNPSNPASPTPAGALPPPDPNAGRGTADATRVPRVHGSFLFGDGDGGPFKGAAYVIPNGTSRMPDFSSMRPFAVMYLDQFSIAPRDFTGGFPGITRRSDWFAIRYNGDFRVPTDGTYKFRLVSDDGAILYVDGAQVVNNDGVHASTSVEGTRNLRAGKHDLRVDYFHTTGSVSLMVFVSHNGKEQVLTGSR